MTAHFIFEASGLDGIKYRLEFSIKGTVLSWLSGIFGI